MLCVEIFFGDLQHSSSHIWSDQYSLNLCSYRSTLKQLFQEFEGGDDSSQLASVTMRIMQALQINLDGKSKQYRDPALTHLFLMNNIHYIVRSVRRYVFHIYRLLVSWNRGFIPYSGGSKLLFSESSSILGLKQRICSGMIGYNDIGGLCSSMQINTKEMLGQRCCFNDFTDYCMSCSFLICLLGYFVISNKVRWLCHCWILILSVGRFFSAYLFRALPHQVVGVVLLVVMVELEVVVVLQEHLLKTGSLSVASLYGLSVRESVRPFDTSMCVLCCQV